MRYTNRHLRDMSQTKLLHNSATAQENEMTDTQCPTLHELRTRPCTLEELQLALVSLIEKHNELNKQTDARFKNTEPKVWRA
jgi:hypothetical protein